MGKDNKKQVTVGVAVLSVVLVGRLLFLFGGKSDKPSKSDYRAIASALRSSAAAASYGMRQTYYQGQSAARPDPFETLKQENMRRRQIMRDEYDRMRAREEYLNASPVGRRTMGLGY